MITSPMNVSKLYQNCITSVSKLKKTAILAVIRSMVTRTGFEPMNACVKGM